jgi:hypothetical protein
MHCHALPDAVVSADAKEARTVDEAEILGFAAEDRPFVDSVCRPERRKPFDHRVSANIAALSYLSILLDNRVRSDAHAVSESGTGVNNGRRVYVHRRSILTCVIGLEYCCPLLAHIVFWVNRTPAGF